MPFNYLKQFQKRPTATSADGIVDDEKRRKKRNMKK